MSEDHYKIYGSIGSPYSMKVRAAMRYRQLPFLWMSNIEQGLALAKGLPPVIPIVQFPDGSIHNDSTPLLQLLETGGSNKRSLYPDNKALRFIALLIEDFADEWLTKAMFHYRWYYEENQNVVSRWLSIGRHMGEGRATIEEWADSFRDRQVGRMPIVGCTPQNKKLIEDSFLEICKLIDRHVCEARPYFFGERPSVAEFGLFGQLYELASDPASRREMIAQTPYCHRWIQIVDDLSGQNIKAWDSPDKPLDAVVLGILQQIGEVYMPFLQANAQAYAKGEKAFTVTLRGHQYTQDAFKYQVKCLQTLRTELNSISGEDRDWLNAVLAPLELWAPLSETNERQTLA